MRATSAFSSAAAADITLFSHNCSSLSKQNKNTLVYEIEGSLTSFAKIIKAC
jgi:hypothetical protein